MLVKASNAITQVKLHC